MLRISDLHLLQGQKKMTDNNLNDLCPELLPLAQMFLSNCQRDGLTCHITVTWRDPASQNACKAEGLSNASAGQSPHNCVDGDGKASAKAFDFALFDNGLYITDGSDARYARAGLLAEVIGLVWGGRWNHPDFDHVEMKNWNVESAA